MYLEKDVSIVQSSPDMEREAERDRGRGRKREKERKRRRISVPGEGRFPQLTSRRAFCFFQLRRQIKRDGEEQKRIPVPGEQEKRKRISVPGEGRFPQFTSRLGFCFFQIWRQRNMESNRREYLYLEKAGSHS